jgi:hypothetical protein
MEATREFQLERWIDQKTNGRIYRLSVETAGDRVIIHGCTSTHYVKQLALAAALDLVRTEQVELDICVGAPTYW